ncbi:MAG: M4 family metallopeptidase [Bacteriovoracaceae bacterium]
MMIKITILFLLFAMLPFSSHAQSNGIIKIYDGQFLKDGFYYPGHYGRLVMVDGIKVKTYPTKDAKKLNKNLSIVRNWFATTFNWNSYDNKGSDIIAIVNLEKHFFLGRYEGKNQNAGWDDLHGLMIFGAGGIQIGGFADAIDIIAHEYTHAIINATSNIGHTYEAGALSEHFGDLMGANINYSLGLKKNPFHIGHHMLRTNLRLKSPVVRNMENPHQGMIKQPITVNEWQEKFPGNSEVHTINGIPNKMASIIIKELGWENTRGMFFKIITSNLKYLITFKDYVHILLEECKGIKSEKDACSVVEKAATEVGLL